MRKIRANRLYICLTASAVFGNGAFAAEFISSDGVELISLGLALILTVATLYFSLKAAAFFKNKTNSAKSRLVLPIIFTAAAILCILAAVYSLEDLIKICANTVAKEMSTGLIILSLVLTVVAIVASKQKVLLKFSVLLLPLCLALILFIFLMSFPYMSIKYLEIKSPPEMNLLITATAKRFLLGFLPVCLPIAVLCLDKPLSAVAGGAIGSGLVIITAVNTILIFGSQFASELSYPYAEAVSAVSVGELFSRMDAALYPICFFPGVVRIAVQLTAAIKLLKKAKKIRKLSI